MSGRSSTRTSALALAGVAASLVASLIGARVGAAPLASPLKVAAAADLALAFRDVGTAFEKKTGEKVIFSFGSTGLLEKQIVEGAPFDVFAAANISFAEDAIKAGVCDASSKALYARGRIVVWWQRDARL